MAPNIRILLADDHVMLRTGLRMLLDAESDLEVIAEATSGPEAVRLSKKHTPDVLIIDLTMPEGSGFEGIARIKETLSATKILVLTMHDEDQYILKALRAGADGYLLKSAADDELIDAIRTIHSGKPFLYSGATSLLLEQQRLPDSTPASNLKTIVRDLSPRELQVLRMIALGHTSRQIAGKLHLSPKTIETYRYRMMEKLGLDDRVDLVRLALNNGLLDNHPDCLSPLD